MLVEGVVKVVEFAQRRLCRGRLQLELHVDVAQPCGLQSDA